MDRPELVTDEHLEYLDELRELGDMNMYGAGPFLRDYFGLDKIESRKIVAYWMKSFGKEDR